MSITRSTMVQTLAATAAAALLLSACNKAGGDTSNPQMAKAFDSAGMVADVANAQQKSHDPCTLLSASDVEPYVGTLASPPYRSTDTRADASADQCTYAGIDGRRILVKPSWDDGGAGAAIAKVPDAVGGALDKAGAGNLSASAHNVMQKADGPWDNSTWIPGGTLMTSKGSHNLFVDVSAASGKKEDAIALAKIGMPRFDNPLDYDGAKAVALAPKPVAHSANACDQITKAAAEAAIGAMSSDPTPSSDGTGCTYHVATGKNARNYAVEYVWEGGAKNYNMLAHGMSTMGEAMGGSIPSMNNVQLDPNAKKMMGNLMKMVGGNTGAAGAVTQVGLQTDTTLKGPWDKASLQHGTQLLALKKDVFVGMDLQSADYEKAKALLTAICSSF